MEQSIFVTTPRYRLAFWAAFLAGIGLCTNGIAQAPLKGWTHPISLLGMCFGTLALVLGAAVLFRRRIGPITGEKQALAALIAVMVVKFALALFY